MINKNLMDELDRLGFGADVDTLETYVINLQDAANAGYPEVTDDVYDMYYNLLKQLKPNSIAFIRNWEYEDYDLEPIDRILERHKIKDSIYIRTMEDLAEFKDALLTQESVDFCTTIDVSGHIARAVYKYGRLVSGTLKGKHKKGKDITRHLRTILPTYIEDWKDYELVEIRGKIVINKETFQKLNTFLKTPLNCVTYLLREDATDSERAELEFICYECIIEYKDSEKNNEIRTVYNMLKYLSNLGFKVLEGYLFESIDYYNLNEKIDAIIRHFEELYEESALYNSDGIFITINNLKKCYEVENSGIGFGQFILKMGKIWESNVYKSIIESIEWVSGKQYKIPKAIIKPVITVTGEEVSEVIIPNIGVLERLKLYPNSEIYFMFGSNNKVSLCDEKGYLVSGLV